MRTSKQLNDYMASYGKNLGFRLPATHRFWTDEAGEPHMEKLHGSREMAAYELSDEELKRIGNANWKTLQQFERDREYPYCTVTDEQLETVFNDRPDIAEAIKSRLDDIHHIIGFEYDQFEQAHLPDDVRFMLEEERVALYDQIVDLYNDNQKHPGWKEITPQLEHYFLEFESFSQTEPAAIHRTLIKERDRRKAGEPMLSAEEWAEYGRKEEERKAEKQAQAEEEARLAKEEWDSLTQAEKDERKLDALIRSEQLEAEWGINNEISEEDEEEAQWQAATDRIFALEAIVKAYQITTNRNMRLAQEFMDKHEVSSQKLSAIAKGNNLVKWMTPSEIKQRKLKQHDFVSNAVDALNDMSSKDIGKTPYHLRFFPFSERANHARQMIALRTGHVVTSKKCTIIIEDRMSNGGNEVLCDIVNHENDDKVRCIMCIEVKPNGNWFASTCKNTLGKDWQQVETAMLLPGDKESDKSPEYFAEMHHKIAAEVEKLRKQAGVAF